MSSINRYHKRHLIVTLDTDLPPVTSIAQAPAGYGLFIALKWGDEILVKEAGLSTAADYFNTSNFQVIPILCPQTASFSATAANHSYYVRSKGDMDAIWGLQPQDGRTKEAMFNPIVFNGNYTSTMWTNVDPNKTGITWQNAPEWVVGSQCYGGQMFAASLQIYQFTTTLPNDNIKKSRAFRKIYPFRREHFGLTWDEYPWLINRYTVAYRKPQENTYSEKFNSLIRYLPFQCLASEFDANGKQTQFKFAGNKLPEYFIPVNWCKAFVNEQA